MKKDSCAIVVLNYNDWKTTTDFVNRVEGFDSIDAIVIVDNCSTDDSFYYLKKLASKRIHVIRGKTNGGYGSGNNDGIKYAVEQLKFRYILVSNPDVYFDNETIKQMITVLERDKKCVQVAPVQKDINGNIIRDFAWKLPSANQFVFTSSLLMWKVLNGYHYKPDILEIKDPFIVDCLPGAFLGLDMKKIRDTNVFDTEFFLYCEEMVLAEKIRSNGLYSKLLTGVYYQHKHAVSINKAIKSISAQRKILTQSRLLFLKKYLHASSLQMLFGHIFFSISDIEAVINEGLIKKIKA